MVIRVWTDVDAGFLEIGTQKTSVVKPLRVYHESVYVIVQDLYLLQILRIEYERITISVWITLHFLTNNPSQSLTTLSHVCRCRAQIISNITLEV